MCEDLPFDDLDDEDKRDAYLSGLPAGQAEQVLKCLEAMEIVAADDVDEDDGVEKRGLGDWVRFISSVLQFKNNIITLALGKKQDTGCDK